MWTAKASLPCRISITRHGCRPFSVSTYHSSGHNRWSKIKHEKGKQDLLKNKSRSFLAKELTLASKISGADPAYNPRLAAALTAAKQAGFPKASIESAVARGQGISPSGKALETLSIEALIAPSIGMIVDCQTDCKPRTLQEVRTILKDHGGTISPTAYMFQKRGRIVFERDDLGSGAEDVLDTALEAGAEDVETDESDRIVVLTEPDQTFSVASNLAKSLDLKIHDSHIIWVPIEDTTVKIDTESIVQYLDALVDDLQKEPSVQSICMNIKQGDVENEHWAQLQSRLAT